MGRKVQIKVSNANAAVTIQEAWEEFYLEKKAMGRVEKTLLGYQKSLEYFVADEFDDNWDYDISEVFKTHVLQWIDTMQDRNLRLTSLNNYLNNVRVFLYWCMDTERGYTPQYTIDLVKGQKPLPKMFTDEEVDTLLRKPTKVTVQSYTEWRCWVITNWVLATGNRASTILNIKMEDVDFDDNTVVLHHTKNKSTQVIPLAASLKSALRLYMRYFCADSKPTDYLFQNVETLQLSYTALAHSFAKYCKDRGCTHTSIHGLRHYFATNCLKNGMPGSKLQKLLGHSTYHMTARYEHLTDEDVRKDYDNYIPLKAR